MNTITSLAFSTALAATEPSPATIPESSSCAQATAAIKGLVKQRPRDIRSDVWQKQIRAQVAAATSANHLNAFGMRCYKAGELSHAGMLFDWALALDPKHVLANYNLACVIARQLQTEGPCDTDFDFGLAFSLLKRAIALDSGRAARAKVDKDFDSLREMMAFRLTVNGTPTTDTETANLYDGVTLWGETPGVQLMGQISFRRTHPASLTGTVTGWIADVNLEQAPVSGTWRTQGARLIVDWAPSTSKDGQSTIPGRTEEISLDNMNHYGHGGWYTSPDWCSA